MISPEGVVIATPSSTVSPLFVPSPSTSSSQVAGPKAKAGGKTEKATAPSSLAVASHAPVTQTKSLGQTMASSMPSAFQGGLVSLVSTLLLTNPPPPPLASTSPPSVPKEEPTPPEVESRATGPSETLEEEGRKAEEFYQVFSSRDVRYSQGPWANFGTPEALKYVTEVFAYQGIVYVQYFNRERKLSVRKVTLKEGKRTRVAWNQPPQEPSNFINLSFAQAAFVETGYKIGTRRNVQKMAQRIVDSGKGRKCARG